jgi:hypothetical protein
VLSAEVFCQRWLVVGIIFLSYSVSLPNCKQDTNGDSCNSVHSLGNWLPNTAITQNGSTHCGQSLLVVQEKRMVASYRSCIDS